MRDFSNVAKHVTEIIRAIGEDPSRPGLLDTPDRVARAWAEMTSGYTQDPKEILSRVFNEEPHYDELALLENIEFQSTCEHHMLPFIGTVDIAYIPRDGRVVGLSKLARLVDCFAKRLQIQERMTQEIALAIEEHLQPLGVAVVVCAHHQCMSCRGVMKADARFKTSCMRGVMRNRFGARGEFLALLRK